MFARKDGITANCRKLNKERTFSGTRTFGIPCSLYSLESASVYFDKTFTDSQLRAQYRGITLDNSWSTLRNLFSATIWRTPTTQTHATIIRNKSFFNINFKLSPTGLLTGQRAQFSFEVQKVWPIRYQSNCATQSYFKCFAL